MTLEGRKFHLKARGFFQLPVSIFNDGAWLVAAPNFGGKKAKLGFLSRDQSKFLSLENMLGAFFHSLGNHANPLERWFESGDRRHR